MLAARVAGYFLLLCVLFASYAFSEGDCGCGSLSRSSGLESGSTCTLEKTAEEKKDSAEGEKKGTDGVTISADEGATKTRELTHMVYIRGGYLEMGQEEDDKALEQHQVLDGESPIRRVQLSGFYLDEHAVTNEQFAEFIEETNFQTDAEKYGWSFVFEKFIDPEHEFNVVQSAPWWVSVPNATWAHPFGPESDNEGIEDHPVVHTSWNDAFAYCKWAGKRLPTEAEHEWASKSGLKHKRYPWGEELYHPGKEGKEKHRCNIWQGKFPTDNTGEDGYVYTSPAKSFEPTAFGLYNIVGNVWEWVNDYWTIKHTREPRVNPKGPESGDRRVQRGGSYMCHASYCYRYRTTARIGNEPDTSTGNLGFRCAKDKPKKPKKQ